MKIFYDVVFDEDIFLSVIVKIKRIKIIRKIDDKINIFWSVSENFIINRIII